MSDWKENVTGTIPCRPFYMVDVWFRDGDLSSGFASDFYWKIDHDIADIIKYKVRKNEAETSEEKEAFESMGGVEWKNGDECKHGHYNYSGANKMTYVGAHPFVSGKHVCLSELKGLVIVDSIWLRKPETPQQREERERLELVQRACLAVRHDYGLMNESDRNFLEKEGMEWLKAFDKAK